MRFVALALATVLGLFVGVGAAEARVDIQVDLASQTMHVASATGEYVWPISSARRGFRTPHGTYGVQRMEVMHRSRKYHNSPMPHSLFFSGGYAIHGTYSVGSLGRPASHGCIRIAPENAAALYGMVRAEGARIAINAAAPLGATRYARQGSEERRIARAERRARTYARQMNGDDDLGLRGAYDPAALGYVPVAPNFYRWMADPVGY